MVKAVQSIARGKAPGPSRTRPEFSHAVVGATGEKPGAAIPVAMCILLADGRPRNSCGPLLLELAARRSRRSPRQALLIIIRRVIGKALLATELEALRRHLLP